MNSQNRQTPFRLSLLFVLSLGLYLCGNWILPLLDRDETYYAEVSREMRDRGDWVVPTFNNEPFYEKPPLTYWCQMGSYEIFGENEFAARFHSAVAVSLTALVIFGFCSRLYDSRTAWRAAIAFALCFHVFVLAHAAVTDMPAVLFVTLATWAGWELLEDRNTGDEDENRKSKRVWWWTFYFSLALIFLAKGPLLILPVGTVLIYAKSGRIRHFWQRMKFVRGLLFTCLLIGFWGVPVLVRTHGEFFTVGVGVHVLQRSFSSLQGHGSHGFLTYVAMLPLYFLTVFASFFPWSVRLPRMVSALKRERSPADVFLIGGVLLTFGIFTLVKTKLPHYTLPAFPLLACLAAPHLRGRFAMKAVAAMGVYLAIALIGFRYAADWLPSKQLAVKSAPLLVPEMKFASVGFGEPSLVWEFRRHLRTWHETLWPEQVEAYMRQPGPRLCIMPADMVAEGLGKVIRVSGFNIAKGKRVDLVLAVKPE